MKQARRSAAVAIIAFWPGMAQSSTDDAWAELRERLVTQCTQLADSAAPGSSIAVTPNEVGTQDHAIALVVMTAPDLPPDISVCVLDKRSGETQLSVPFSELPDLTQAGQP